MGVVGQTVLARSLWLYTLSATKREKKRKEIILSPTVTVCEEEKLSYTKDNFLVFLVSTFLRQICLLGLDPKLSSCVD